MSLSVLIAAENASGRFGGEAALPLHYFRILRRRGIPVWLVTHARTRDELQALFPGETRIVFVEDSNFHRAMWRIGKRLPARFANFTVGFLSRLSTQLSQRRIVRRLVREHGIRVVHQPMPVSPREPSLLFALGAPVVIGPMNGGMDYPPAFRRARGSVEQGIVSFGRSCASALNTVLPGKRRAAALIVANERTRNALPRGASRHVVQLVENGVDISLWQPRPADAASDDAVTTFIFMGRLVDWKAVDLLLLAFAQACREVPMRLEILGDGDERIDLEQLAGRLELVDSAGVGAGRVRFAGWQSQSDCVRRLQQADCLVLPSLLECGGAVVLEAMALGKPVIATAWGGPLDYLDARCGVLVPPDSRDAVIAGFARAMVDLARSAAMRAALGAEGIAKVRREYDWEQKVDRVLRLFADVADGRAPTIAR